MRNLVLISATFLYVALGKTLNLLGTSAIIGKVGGQSGRSLKILSVRRSDGGKMETTVVEQQ